MVSLHFKSSPNSHNPFHSPEIHNEDRPLLAHFHGYDNNGSPRPFPTAPVTPLVREARYAIVNALDTSLTRDELGSPEIYLALLLPIVRRYREERRETAAVYAFLLNRWQFLKDAESDIANARVNETRAHACEIVAIKILKAFSMRQLIDVLTYDFSPVKRKDTRFRLYLPHFDGEPSTEPMSALEVAISGKAKHFLSHPLVQEIINQIWLGEIVFFSNAIDNPQSCHNASPSEIRTVTVYYSSDIKFLRLSRLRVPRYKTTFQMVSSSVFIIVYTFVTFAKKPELTAMEMIMDLWALSLTLDELVQLKDSGPSFYFETVWNLFDVPIYIIFLVFIILRITTFFNGSIELTYFAYDFLACNSILLWPRLFAALDHYKFFGTMLIVLRQMLIDATLFLALSFIFYVGFQQAFYALHDNTQSYGEIAWLLLQVFFGSAFLGFEQASELSERFGAPLMVLFVAISVLMLYTLLISIFSQTFAEVSANAKEEFMFLFSVKVMEEVKSDALYEFQPPFNILASIVIWPCSLLYPPEVVGKVSRVLLRFFYFPELVCIWVFETLAIKKKGQSSSVRPGWIGHQASYGSISELARTDSMAISGSAAKRRQEEGAHDGGFKASNVESTRGDAISPLDVSDPMTDPFQNASTRAFMPSSVSQYHQQQLDQLNTRELAANAQASSPFMENMRRFGDPNMINSMMATNSITPVMRSESKDVLDQPQYSYYSPAPIKMATRRTRRRSSMPVNCQPRYGADATLASTSQGILPSYRNEIGGEDMSASIGDNMNGIHHQYQSQDQQYEGTQELVQLMETRFEEMWIHMNQIESKIDQLMDVLITTHQNSK
ncbi:hypothetical protein BCR41DRAFT_386386 [Lobosporangium transversale]|uniref:Ion transport domain-containing protein n=1 Tax=Lobosporangium transversale TaxID=64571 RepID=A0A1Y2GNZ0_9FUNG|nr:hypothetical protein BCR41DRAFT_386386 [Lobosporangium transversale]ORZ16850.1 hypothetical protein BCR41DRAFT_386386 [Lobosporangium transversale]|eukprot:XP_021881785.1 hypothetical protein BCR41DRAFT_386386 [Lobosporangium transversale]